jgi:hypothetical protein
VIGDGDDVKQPFGCSGDQCIVADVAVKRVFRVAVKLNAKDSVSDYVAT